MERQIENQIIEFAQYDERLKKFLNLLSPDETYIVLCKLSGFDVKQIAKDWGTNREEVQAVLRDVREKAAEVFGEKAVEGRRNSKKKFSAF